MNANFNRESRQEAVEESGREKGQGQCSKAGDNHKPLKKRQIPPPEAPILPSYYKDSDYFRGVLRKMKRGIKPGHPPSDFIRFSEIRRVQLKEFAPSWSQNTRFKFISKEWRNMSEEAKQPFKEHSRLDYTAFKLAQNIWIVLNAIKAEELTEAVLAARLEEQGISINATDVMPDVLPCQRKLPSPIPKTEAPEVQIQEFQASSDKDGGSPSKSDPAENPTFQRGSSRRCDLRAGELGVVFKGGEDCRGNIHGRRLSFVGQTQTKPKYYKHDRTPAAHQKSQAAKLSSNTRRQSHLPSTGIAPWSQVNQDSLLEQKGSKRAKKSLDGSQPIGKPPLIIKITTGEGLPETQAAAGKNPSEFLRAQPLKDRSPSIASITSSEEEELMRASCLQLCNKPKPKQSCFAHRPSNPEKRLSPEQGEALEQGRSSNIRIAAAGDSVEDSKFPVKAERIVSREVHAEICSSPSSSSTLQGERLQETIQHGSSDIWSAIMLSSDRPLTTEAAMFTPARPTDVRSGSLRLHLGGRRDNNERIKNSRQAAANSEESQSEDGAVEFPQPAQSSGSAGKDKTGPAP